MLYDRVADLDLAIDGYELTRRERDTSSGFTRTTTVVSLHGDGETGQGEDVTYASEAHYALRDSTETFPVAGDQTLDSFSKRLATVDLFPENEPAQPVSRNYRQWALESAALDLALKQAGTSLANRLDRAYDPVRFVVSTRLAEPPTGERIDDWLDRNPALEFKLDPTADWSTDVVERLAATDAVRTLDLKGQYHGTTVDQPADSDLYERIIEGFPAALIEDPALNDETRALFAGHEGRVTWDYPIRSVDTVEDLPWEPAWLNIKPSRFGSVASLLDTIDHCRAHDIAMYGGGQFELGVGREHIHALASLFYPDGPNDVAPRAYNDPHPSGDLPTSPLAPPSSPRGLEWS
jgi:L-alanine-DL-glutamate epimerase-like enolase superfamily enzyme